MTQMLEGKKLLVTGVLNDDSIAFGVAKLAQDEGAEIVLTSFGRAMSLTRRTARRLSPEPDVLELDVTDPAHLAAVAAERGYVDDVIEPTDTRRLLTAGLLALRTKRATPPSRAKHSNTPL